MTVMDCGEVRDLLHAYIDGELPAEERAAIDDHLQRCPTCAATLTSLRALGMRIRGAGTYAPPAEFEARLRQALAHSSGDRERTGWQTYARLAASHLAALAVGGAVVFALLWERDARSQIVHDVIAAHVRALLTDQLVQVASSDSHTVKPWFVGRITYAPSVKDLTAAGFPLLGGRVDYLLDRPVAAIVYGRRKHRINLFVVPLPDVARAPRFDAARNGYTVVAWRDETFAYFATADLAAAELEEFAALVRGGG